MYTPIRFNITSDAIRTCVQGAIGAMTFGMYHQYTTNRIMDINNARIDHDIQRNREIMEQERQRDREVYEAHINELSEKISQLEKRSKSWF